MKDKTQIGIKYCQIYVSPRTHIWSTWRYPKPHNKNKIQHKCTNDLKTHFTKKVCVWVYVYFLLIFLWRNLTNALLLQQFGCILQQYGCYKNMDAGESRHKKWSHVYDIYIAGMGESCLYQLESQILSLPHLYIFERKLWLRGYYSNE